ncbi:3-deoxy-7-phosphoheptulonate synthase [Candidatus Woesearchaeota archaeon]|nr:3-deoxy-7-phosphoheptulonate synthase [Candidatus Woesearchaeota archaeon]
MSGKIKTVDRRIREGDPLVTPRQLYKEYPYEDVEVVATVASAIDGIERILRGRDDRIFIVAGPCSIHNVYEAREYAAELKSVHDAVSDRIIVLMRQYFEKPRTDVGWKGLINDPNLNGSFDMSMGYALARGLLYHTAKMGLPAATEFLTVGTPRHLDGLVSWACIGARSVEDQEHREMASGLSMPVGFKNGTDGDLEKAINAIKSARTPHTFAGHDVHNKATTYNTDGHPYGHLVLRGGKHSQNYDSVSVSIAFDMLEKEGLPPVVMIDCSHGNSGKDYRRQPEVFEDVAGQIVDQQTIANGYMGGRRIVGIMLESNLLAGSQKIPADLKGFSRSTLQRGVSVTDSCIDIATTRDLIMRLHRDLTSITVGYTAAYTGK